MTLVKTAKPNILTNMPPLWLQYNNISPHNRKNKKRKNKRMNNFYVYDELQTMCYLQLWRQLSFRAGALHEDLPVLQPIRLWQPAIRREIISQTFLFGTIPMLSLPSGSFQKIVIWTWCRQPEGLRITLIFCSAMRRNSFACWFIRNIGYFLICELVLNLPQ